jgi:hypothetical protein
MHRHEPELISTGGMDWRCLEGAGIGAVAAVAGAVGAYE